MEPTGPPCASGEGAAAGRSLSRSGQRFPNLGNCRVRGLRLPESSPIVMQAAELWEAKSIRLKEAPPSNRYG